MIETWLDVVRVGAAGAAGGLIYWGMRHHGDIFIQLWRRLVRR
jgi:hypothetical protein